MKTLIRLKKRGQVVIPQPIRDALELEEGDLIEVDISKYQKNDCSSARLKTETAYGL